MLATKFLDALGDQLLQYTVYAQAAEPLSFSDVLSVFARCARPVRAKEALQRPAQRNQRQIQWSLMVELVKGINHLSMVKQERQDFGRQTRYQPIAGTVGVERRRDRDQQNYQPAPGADPANQPYQPPQNQPYQLLSAKFINRRNARGTRSIKTVGIGQGGK